mgnify:CR=1 FL=1
MTLSTAKFPRDKLTLLNVMARACEKTIAEYLSDLVQRDADEKGVVIPKPQQPPQAA